MGNDGVCLRAIGTCIGRGQRVGYDLYVDGCVCVCCLHVAVAAVDASKLLNSSSACLIFFQPIHTVSSNTPYGTAPAQAE